ncbi:hypothetical protein QJS66_08095 [Kocuria rhizophila]|nr:hypothetical protein QJS66_08095 [Kocuria rhizophila]
MVNHTVRGMAQLLDAELETRAAGSGQRADGVRAVPQAVARAR